ncbi:MAG: N-6 DNA methylase [Bacteroidales bacterium]|jgi:type I restriction enzyme M protein|nr:N-6 DNA methylase [Bacteroidales bacterium]
MAKNELMTITDYISGVQVNATPEEIDAVQVFSKQLVEDYGYPKEHIQTRPQHRVKVRPCDTKKEYPVDIAVFLDQLKDDDGLYIVVECKKKTRKDGRTQLENYLTLSSAYLGVWFNGEERFFIRKFVKPNREVFFEEIPNIPKYKQRIEDIGQFKRSDLKPTHNLKAIFKSIRNHLAANTVGATRDEILAQQLINIIFCKIYDEKYTAPDEMVKFRAGIDEKPKEIEKRILDLFNDLKTKYPEVIDKEDKITLDTNSISFIVGELQNYALMNCERDVVADAFETFIDHALKGGLGQFFTPRNVVKMIVDILQPTENDKIIDPACGSGGFLIETLKSVWAKMDEKYQKLDWNKNQIEREKIEIATKNFRGIDKDYFLSKVAKAYMNLVGDGTTGIFCEDSLEKFDNWKAETKLKIQPESFDIVLTNPPFGKEIKVVGKDKLQQFDLAHEWKKIDNAFVKTNKLKDDVQPQILFIERCFQLLKTGGKLGIILPETFFHAPKLYYILEFFKKHNVMWVIDLPHNTFRPLCNAKCCVLFIQKGVKQQEKINMGVAVEMGHDHNGKPMYRWDTKTQTINKNEIWDDIDLLINEITDKKNAQKYTFDINSSLAFNQKVLVPRYFWNSREQEIEKSAKEQNCTLVSVSDLIKRKIITHFDGHGSPEADNKGMGDVPYIRVKDIVNWDVYKDPTALIPYHVFEKMRTENKKLQEKDLLFVRRGSYRIGSVALVSPYDTEVLLTREILVLRILKEINEYGITPYYLIYLFSNYLVQMQMYNKILMETTLPNIANRWAELRLPIHNDNTTKERISEKIKSVFDKKWEAQKTILEIKQELGNLTT